MQEGLVGTDRGTLEELVGTDRGTPGELFGIDRGTPGELVGSVGCVLEGLERLRRDTD